MFVYISGKIINVIDHNLILKLPNGIGYNIMISPVSKYQVNENLSFYVITQKTSSETLYFGFDSFNQWQLATTILSKGIDAGIVADLIWSLGVPKLHQSILQKDDSYLKKVSGLNTKSINKILEIDDQEIPASRSNINGSMASDEFTTDQSNDKYSPSDFTQRLASLGYSRSRIVGVISVLKKENLWGNMSLVDLVKKSMEILET